MSDLTPESEFIKIHMMTTFLKLHYKEHRGDIELFLVNFRLLATITKDIIDFISQGKEELKFPLCNLMIDTLKILIDKLEGFKGGDKCQEV